MIPEIGKPYCCRMKNPDCKGREDSYWLRWGICEWIHPKLRFCLVRFPDLGIRECFPLSEMRCGRS